MSRSITKVELTDGDVAYLRTQTAGQYIDMEAALDATNSSDAPSSEKIRRALALKIAGCLCDANGALLHPAGTDVVEVLERFTWIEAKTLVDQVNKNNGLDKKQLEETEKK